jgi:uncharacterized membrane protein
MVTINTSHRWTLIRLITMASVLVCLLGMATLVRAQPPTPEEELAAIKADLETILDAILENNDYTHETLGKLSNDVSANRNDISGLRLELSNKIDTSSAADRRDMSQLREEISQLRSELISRIDVNRKESREDISELSSRIDDNRKESREDISRLTNDLNSKFNILFTAIIGVPSFIAALMGIVFWRKQEKTGG